MVTITQTTGPAKVTMTQVAGKPGVWVTKHDTLRSTQTTATLKVIAPAKWTFDTLAKLVKTAAEVEAATINEALPRGDDAFDPDTATPEECQAFLARQAGRGAPRT